MDEVLAGFVGLCMGILSGSALSALYIAIGLFSKLHVFTRYRHAYLYYVMAAAAGAGFGTVISVFDVTVRFNGIFPPAMGFFGGVFIGMYIACLAEVINVVPLFKKSGIPRLGIAILLLSFAVGKTVGSLLYWFSTAFSG